MTDTRSVISPTPHSVQSNINHTVESETLCQSRLLTETTECLLDMPNDDTGMTKLDDVLIPDQALSLSWLTSNCNTRTHMTVDVSRIALEGDDCWKAAPHVMQLYQRSMFIYISCL